MTDDTPFDSRLYTFVAKLRAAWNDAEGKSPKILVEHTAIEILESAEMALATAIGLEDIAATLDGRPGRDFDPSTKEGRAQLAKDGFRFLEPDASGVIDLTRGHF